MAEFASKGVAGAGLGLGIAGTTLGLLNGGLGIFGRGCGNDGYGYGRGGYGHGHGGCCEPVGCGHGNYGVYGCGTPYGLMGESTPVNRYELCLEQQIAEKGSVIAALTAEKYTDHAVAALGNKLECHIDKLNEKFEVKVDRLAEKTNYQFDCVEKQICNQNVVNATMVGTLSCQAQAIQQLQCLTKTVIPLSSLCPEAMPRYNVWTPPTTVATATAE